MRAKVLVLVMAGGAGGRLELLTDRRAKPAMPWGGLYRLIDFPLSNCRHSGLEDVWVIEQFNPFSLSDHLANGRPWDLDRTYGGLVVLHPHLGSGDEGWHRGTADAVWRNRTLVRDFGADALLVLSADAVYRLDYRAVVDGHLQAGADLTLVTTKVPAEDASRYGIVEADGERVTRYAYKPGEPSTDLAANEIMVFQPDLMLETLEEVAAEAGDGSEALKDFGNALLPRLVGRGKARQHRMEGYWRDVGTLDSYWSSHMELLGEAPAFDLLDPAWPIHTRGMQRPAARISRGASVDDALISPGALVRGRVEHAVLSPGVVVEPGATVRHAVLLDDVVVRSGATVECAIVDSGARIGERARVGGPSGDLAIVGQDAEVDPGVAVPPGGRVPGPADEDEGRD